MDASPPQPSPIVRTIIAFSDPPRLGGPELLEVPDRRPPLWLPLMLVLSATIVLRITNIDLAVSGIFYDRQTGDWPLLTAQPWDWLYHWGVVSGVALGVVGLITYMLSFCVTSLRQYRRAGGFLALALIIGPGLIVNGVMKPCWGRPRPCQIVEFGGDVSYVPPLDMGHQDRSESFPSGHAAIGFALIAPMFLAYRRHRYLAAAFCLLGLGGGIAMGITRIVQGRHFVSDVLWSAAAVYFTCWLLGAIMQLYAPAESAAETGGDDAEQRLRVIRLDDQAGWKASDDNRQEHKRAA